MTPFRVIFLAAVALVSCALVATGHLPFETLFLLPLGAVTANQVIKRQELERGACPVYQSTTIYEGTFCFVNTSGYLTGDTDSGASRFAGIAIDKYDNSSGSDGDIDAEFYRTGVFELTGTGFAITDVGSEVYASDNYTITLTDTSTSVPIGVVAEYVSSTAIRVRIAGMPQQITETGNVLTFDGSTGANEIRVPDNLADALSIEGTHGDFMVFVTTNSSEEIVLADQTRLPDDIPLVFGTGSDAAILWSDGDASNHALVIGIGDTSQQVHITDKAAIATDWARAAGTHPELAIHSNTTPATDYLAIGNHDGTTAYIDVVGGTTLALAIAGTNAATLTASALNLAADDMDLTLGAGADAVLRWSDGDADNHSVALGLGDSNQALHITDKAAIATDWNVAADTHPSVYIHSNTTPATDYLKIGSHDGTTATIDVVGGTTLDLAIAGSDIAGVKATGLFVGTYVEAGTTAGDNQLTLQSTGTAPTGTGANVGHLYADYETDDDELFWLSGTGGTATQLTT